MHKLRSIQINIIFYLIYYHEDIAMKKELHTVCKCCRMYPFSHTSCDTCFWRRSFSSISSLFMAFNFLFTL